MSQPLPQRPSAGPLLQVGLALLVGGNLVLFSYLALHTGLDSRDRARHERVAPAAASPVPRPALVLPEPSGGAEPEPTPPADREPAPTLVAAAPEGPDVAGDGAIEEPPPPADDDDEPAAGGNDREKPDGPSAKRTEVEPGRLPRDLDDEDDDHDDDDDDSTSGGKSTGSESLGGPDTNAAPHHDADDSTGGPDTNAELNHDATDSVGGADTNAGSHDGVDASLDGSHGGSEGD